MYTQSALGRAIGTKVACIASVAFLIVTGTSQADDNWTGASPLNDFWSTGVNWEDGTPPGFADIVTFNAVDSGGTNIIDTNFTIAGLEYIGNGVHTTSVTGGNLIQVDGAASVGIGDGSNGGTATWAGTGTFAIGNSGDPQTLRIGVNTTTSGVMTGTLSVEEDGLDVNFQLSDLIVGSSAGGAATGTLRWNQTEAINATSIYFGRGKGATGILDVPAGGIFILGSPSQRVDNLRIAYDNTRDDFTGTTMADLDYTVNNPTFEAYIGSDLSIGHRAREIDDGGGNVIGALTLASNSLLDVGTLTSQANVHIGRNQDQQGLGTGGLGSATGELDALDSAATVNLQLNELNVGFSRGGAATGTLRWNQTETINATSVYFGRGKGATGILDVPAGGTFILGSPSERVDNLRIAYDNTRDDFTSTTTADLDFTVNNPTFKAYIGSDLSVGHRADDIDDGGGDVIGSLKLASNSLLDVGTLASPASIHIGRNQDQQDLGAGGLGSATGELNALDLGATVNLQLNELNVGFSRGGAATGTLRWNQTEVINATSVYFGRGKGATGILDVPAGGTFILGSPSGRVDNLRIAYDNTRDDFTSTTTADLDFTVNNPTFKAYIGSDLSVGHRADDIDDGGGDVIGSLKLASNSLLDVGTLAGPASIHIGRNQDQQDLGAGGLGSATGELNALDLGATVNLQLNELNVGFSRGGAATGTLRWNQTETITATSVYFGRGKGATGILDVPAGGTFILGSPSERVDNLRIAYDNTRDDFTSTTTADLDFTVNNPTFKAYIGSDLSVGHRADDIDDGGGDVIGSLKLASNSLLDVGTLASPASIHIGRNQDQQDLGAGGLGSATGVLDIQMGTATMQLNQLNVGRSSGGGVAEGTFTMGTDNTVTATTVNIGTGTNASGTVNLTGGLMTANTINLEEGAFNFTGGRLAVNTFNGTLDQQGGTLAPGVSPTTTSIAGVTAINGDYNLFSAGILEIELFGATPGSEFDQVFVNGLVNLNADNAVNVLGGMLDVNLGFAASVGDTFTIVENDEIDLVTAAFFGLPEGMTFNEVFGNQIFEFGITYVGGSGNDIVLNIASVSNVPVPPAVWLFGSGLLGLVGVARRRAVL